MLASLVHMQLLGPRLSCCCSLATRPHHLALRSVRMQSTAVPERADAVLSYWLGKDYAQPQPPGYWAASEQTSLWFKGGSAVDQHIKEHFADDVSKLAAGGYDDWLQQPLSALAGIVLADQFTRNIFRGTAEAFSLDSRALQWSQQLRVCDAQCHMQELPGTSRQRCRQPPCATSATCPSCTASSCRTRSS